MGVSSRRGRMAAGVGSVVAVLAVSLFGIVGPANAEVENPPLITGTPVVTAECAEGVATFTVTVPKVNIDADAVDGNFWIDGAAVGVESFEPLATFEPFVRSTTVTLAELPATLSVTYGFDGGTILAAQPFTFTVESCGVTPPPSVQVETVRMDSYCEGTTSFGVVRVTASFPEGAEPASLSVVYGAEQSLGSAQTVSATGEYSFSGQLPPGNTDFTVLLNGFPSGEGTLVVKSCETTPPPPGDGGTDQPGTPGTPDNGGQDESIYTPKQGGEFVTGLDTAPVSSNSPFGLAFGGIGLLAAAAITFAVVYLVRQRRTQPVKG